MLIIGVYECGNSVLSCMISGALGASGGDVLELSPSGAWRVWRGGGRKFAVMSLPCAIALSSARPHILALPASADLRGGEWHNARIECGVCAASGSLVCDEGVLKAGQFVTYGMSPKDTITVSSLDGTVALAVQRGIKAMDGTVFERQEIILDGFGGISPERLLAAASALIAAGISPEALSGVLGTESRFS